MGSYAGKTTVLRRHLNQPDRADDVIAALVAANPGSASAHLVAADYWSEFGRPELAEDSLAVGVSALARKTPKYS